MITYSEVDIQVSASGDICLSSNGDLKLAQPSGVLKQDITFRVRTDYNDFTPHPDIGADLSSLLGEPNTRELSIQGEQQIVHCLTQDGRILNGDLMVKGVPIAMDKVVYYIFIKDGPTVLNLTPDVVLSMDKGILQY
jgi:hypothetical protein